MNQPRRDSQLSLHRLDDLDVRIIRELRSPGSPQWNVRETYSNIARRVGVDEETVRRRVNRLEEEGVLQKWRIMLNPHIIGFEMAGVDLEVDREERKPEVVSQIGKLEGVTTIVDFHGKGLEVVLYYENDKSLQEATRQMRLVSNSSTITVWKSPFPRPSGSMKKLDWEIVNAMRDDPRRDLDEVGRLLRVSVRSVQRRLSTLTSEKAVYLVGTPAVNRLGGLIGSFLVFCPDSLKKSAADKVVRSTLNGLAFIDSWPEQYSVLGVVCQNLAEADQVLATLKGLYEVQSVKMGIVKDFIRTDAWLDSEIREHAKKES